jgi:hypothetical protein
VPTPEGFLASISLPISGVRVREHFNYVNTTLQNSGYSVVAPMDHVLELIKEWEHGGEATAFGWLRSEVHLPALRGLPEK